MTSGASRGPPAICGTGEHPGRKMLDNDRRNEIPALAAFACNG